MGFFTNKKLALIHKRIENKSKIKRYIEFLFGCLLVAIAFNLFLSPNDLVYVPTIEEINKNERKR